MIYLYSKKFQQAILYNKKAISLKPDSPIAHLALGNCYKYIQEYKKAKASWEKAKNLYKGKNDLEAVRKIDKLIKQLPQ